MVNVKLIEGQEWYYLTNICGDREVYTFILGYKTEKDVIVRLEFELTQFSVAVEHVSHYAPRAYVRVRVCWIINGYNYLLQNKN